MDFGNILNLINIFEAKYIRTVNTSKSIIYPQLIIKDPEKSFSSKLVGIYIKSVSISSSKNLNGLGMKSSLAIENILRSYFMFSGKFTLKSNKYENIYNNAINANIMVGFPPLIKSGPIPENVIIETTLEAAANAGKGLSRIISFNFII